MTQNHMEIESKFYVRDLGAVETRLIELQAERIMPRTFEYNLRFDNLNHTLQHQHKVLRLRKSDDIRLTFKGPGVRVGGALSRTEIELVVNDFDTAQKLVEGLGYHVAAVYEKYRAMYRLGSALITLDELPYGRFVEIEGENPEQITSVARQLALDPDAAIPSSYQGLFEQVKAAKNLGATNLTFWEFEKIELSPADLGVEPADQPASAHKTTK